MDERIVSIDLSTEEDQETVSATAAVVKVADALEAINRRYHVIREVGRGGMGSVFLVEDALCPGVQLALKSVRRDRLDPKTLAILRNEFLSLASLSHPNVMQVYDFGADLLNGDLFFTCEFFPGVGWDEDEGVPDSAGTDVGDFSSVLEVLIQVLRGLEFIHAQGVVHGDLKPDNIMVRREDGTCRAKLIDFGLAKQEGASGGKKIFGTPYYVAPETILGSSVDRRTDLYSLGVVLYRLLTGNLPFPGESNLEILRSHVEQAPTPPSKVVRQIPQALEAIVLRLMEKDPDDRYGSALEVLYELTESMSIVAPLETRDTLSSYIDAAALVGREKERRRIGRAFFSVSKLPPENGEGYDGFAVSQIASSWLADDMGASTAASGCILLRGEPGVGRHNLLAELRALAQIHGALCVEYDAASNDQPEGSVGGGFAGLLERLQIALPSVRGAPVGLEERLEHFRGHGRSGRLGPEIHRLAEEFTEFCRETPVLLSLHHVDAADTGTLQFLRSLVEIRGNAEEDSRWVLALTAPDGNQNERSPFDTAWKDREFRSCFLDLRLQRLHRSTLTRFVTHAFQGSVFPARFNRMVYEESDGNPSVASAILKHLTQRQLVARVPEGWALVDGWQKENVPGRVRHEMRQRISALPHDAKLLASAFACIGPIASLEFATALAELEEKKVVTAVRILVQSRILELQEAAPSGIAYSFVYESARSLVYESMEDGQRRAFHAEAGRLGEERYLERGHLDQVELARHFIAAGEGEKSIEHGLAAGVVLAARFDFVDALKLYDEMRDIAGDDDPVVSRRILLAMGDLRLRLGDFNGADEILTQVCAPIIQEESEAPDAGDRAAKCDGRWAGAALRAKGLASGRCGEFESAREWLARAAVSVETPEERVEHLLACAEVAAHEGARVESLRLCEALEEIADSINDSLAQARWRLLQADNHAFFNDKTTAASYCQLALRTLESEHDKRFLPLSLFARGRLYKYKSQYVRARKQFQMALLLSEKKQLTIVRVESLLELGDLDLTLGRYEDAIATLETGAQVAEQSGNRPLLRAIQASLGSAYRLAGDAQGVRAVTRDLLREKGELEQRHEMRCALTYAEYCLDAGEGESCRKFLSQAKAKDSLLAGTTEHQIVAHALDTEQRLYAGEFGAALDASSKGILAARENHHPALLSRLVFQHGVLLCQLGHAGEARRRVVALFELAKRYQMPVTEGHAQLLKACVFAEREKWVNAAVAFDRALGFLGPLGNSRDRLQFFLHRASAAVRGGNDSEQAYLSLKEGMFLAKRLDLPFATSHFCLWNGLFELAQGAGRHAEAQESLQTSIQISAKHGYLGVLWQAQFHLAQLLVDSGRAEKAQPFVAASWDLFQQVLASMPTRYRASYARRTSSERLQSLRATCLSGG